VESLPAGVDLAVPKIPEVGRTGATVGGRAFRIGQLFNQVTGSGDRLLFVLRRDGLAQISQTAALLLQAGGAGEPVRLDAAAVAAAPISSDRSMAGLLPDLGTARWEDPRGRALCAQQQPSGTDAVDSTVVLTAAENAMVGESGSVTVRARVGTAMLGYPVPRPTSQQAAGRYLISEDGMVYQIADTDALKALRLAGCRQVPIPRYLLLGIPAGPVLSRSAIAVSGQG